MKRRLGARAGARRTARRRGTTADRSVVLVAIAALVAACGTATACGDDDVTGPRTDVDHLLEAPQWDLIRIERSDGTVVDAVDGPRGVPSLVFTTEALDDGRRFDADTGCNLGGGAYVAEDGGSLEFRGFGWTEMACLEPGVRTVEQAFQEAMATVHAFRVGPEGLALELEFDGGEMVFRALLEDDPEG